MAARRLSQRQNRILQWLAADHQRTRGMITSSHQDLVRALSGDKGNISHSLHTLEVGAWLSSVVRPAGKPNPYGSPRRVRNGPRSFQKVVIKGKKRGSNGL